MVHEDETTGLRHVGVARCNSIDLSRSATQQARTTVHDKLVVSELFCSLANGTVVQGEVDGVTLVSRNAFRKCGSAGIAIAEDVTVDAFYIAPARQLNAPLVQSPYIY